MHLGWFTLPRVLSWLNLSKMHFWRILDKLHPLCNIIHKIPFVCQNPHYKFLRAQVCKYFFKCTACRKFVGSPSLWLRRAANIGLTKNFKISFCRHRYLSSLLFKSATLPVSSYDSLRLWFACLVGGLAFRNISINLEVICIEFLSVYHPYRWKKRCCIPTFLFVNQKGKRHV